jgi:hypothetical protein
LVYVLTISFNFRRLFVASVPEKPSAWELYRTREIKFSVQLMSLHQAVSNLTKKRLKTREVRRDYLLALIYR